MANTSVTDILIVGRGSKKLFDELKGLTHLDGEFSFSDLEERLPGLTKALDAAEATRRFKCFGVRRTERGLEVSQEEDWHPRVLAWEVLLKEYFPQCSLYFQGEELDTDIYVTNDVDGKFFPDRFIVHYMNDDGDEEEVRVSTEEQLFELARKWGFRKINSMADVDRLVEDSEWDFHYHRCEISEPKNWA